MNTRTGIVTTTLAVVASATLLTAGCARVKVDPIEVKTIHIVHDVNIRVDKQLDEFFAFQEQPATTQPATMAAAATQPMTAQPSTQPTTTAVAGDVK
jgi:hypothetical protein